MKSTHGQKLILIITHSRDLSADLVIRHLCAGGHDYVRLDTDQLASVECFFGFRAGPELHIDGRVILTSEVSSIWARRFAVPLSLRKVRPEQAQFVTRELMVVMDAFLEGAAHAFQINRYHADRLAGNRLLQALRARKLGFSTPKSLVTQNADDARVFLNSHPRAITKALSFGRISSSSDNELVAFSSLVPNNVNLEGLICCPSLLQEMVPKRFDWRVTTVGDRVFSARVMSDPSILIDWRADKDAVTKFSRADLPREVSDRLVTLSHQSELIFGAHDLIENTEGEFFFLETNPAGQWGWLELTLGLPIGQAIADELIAHARG